MCKSEGSCYILTYTWEELAFQTIKSENLLLVFRSTDNTVSKILMVILSKNRITSVMYRDGSEEHIMSKLYNDIFLTPLVSPPPKRGKT